MTEKRYRVYGSVLLSAVLLLVGCETSTTGNGTGDPPECGLSVSSLDFGEVGVGTLAELPFTITNTGGGTLNGTVFSPCEPYTIVGSPSYSLNADQTHTFTIRFTPTEAGQIDCTIETGNSDCGDVAVTGVGGSECCAVSPVSIDFRGVELMAHKDTAFVITNCGLDPINGTISLACAHYSVLSGGGAWALQPGEADTVTIRYAPTANGTHACTVNLGKALCPTVALTGQAGEVECFISDEDHDVDFDTVRVGQTKDTIITIVNDGTVPLDGTIAVRGTCGDFILVQGDIYHLAPGEIREVTLRFQPQSAGAKQCYFLTNTTTVTADGLDACSDIIVRGVGRAAGGR